MNNRSSKREKGFTLIELLVVIAIISLLASIILAMINGVRAKARDAVRMHDFDQFETALTIFYDEYGIYPCGDNNSDWDTTSSPTFINGTPGGGAMCPTEPFHGIYDEGLYPLIGKEDPLNSGFGSSNAHYYGYKVSPNRDSYILWTRFESSSNYWRMRDTNDMGRCDNYYERGPGTGILIPEGLDGWVWGHSCD